MQIPYYPCQTAPDPASLAELKDIDKTLGIILVLLGVWFTCWLIDKMRELYG
jgi:hypothetical protein